MPHLLTATMFLSLSVMSVLGGNSPPVLSGSTVLVGSIYVTGGTERVGSTSIVASNTEPCLNVSVLGTTELDTFVIEKSDTSGSYLELGMGPYSFTNQTLAPEHAIRFINESGNIEDSTFLTDPGNPFNITWRHEYGQKCLKANSMYDLCDTGDRFYFVIECSDANCAQCYPGKDDCKSCVDGYTLDENAACGEDTTTVASTGEMETTTLSLLSCALIFTLASK